MYGKVFFPTTVVIIALMAVLVSCKKDRQTPDISITMQPQANVNVQQSHTERLSITASATGGARLNYQWYSNTSPSNTSGMEINGAKTPDYDIPTNLSAGKYYYFCEASATDAISVRSDVATVTVLSPDEFDEGVTINGVTWATRNVAAPGRFSAKPESMGMFYQWNLKIEWSATVPPNSSPTGTTWNSSDTAGSAWEADKDPCPPGWQAPSKEQLEKLIAAGSISESYQPSDNDIKM